MYLKDGDDVVLRMTQKEYDILLTALGSATAYACLQNERWMWLACLELMNSLNSQNSNYTPYEVPDAPSD